MNIKKKLVHVTASLVGVLLLASAEAADVTIGGATATPWIIKQDGKLLVETSMAITNSGAARKMWVRVAVPGQAPRIESLGDVAVGATNTIVRHPELSKDGDMVGFALFDNEKGAGQPVAAMETVLPKARHWTVYISTDMHQDVGFTEYQEQLKHHTWPKYLDMVFDAIAKNTNQPPTSRVRYAVESSMMLYDSALLARNADWLEKLREHLRNADIAYAETFGSLAQENMSAEELVRSSYYSRRHLVDILGVPGSGMANMCDNNSLTRSAIDALAGAGVKHYKYRANTFLGYDRGFDDHRLYYVEGFNPANRLLVQFTKFYNISYLGGYNKAGAGAFLMKLQGDPKYPYDAYHDDYGTGDNGPPNLPFKDIQRMNDLGYEWPKFIADVSNEFFRYIEKNFADKIPVYRWNVENSWNFGVGSTARETAIHKRTQETLASAEMMATFAGVSGPSQAYPHEDLTTAWKNMALYAEHTWGFATCAPDESWKWKRNTALQPEAVANRVMRESMAAMNGRIPAEGPTLAVWNFTPWQRTDVVRLDAGVLSKGDGLRDVATGQVVPVQMDGAGGLVFLATDVPGLGYKTYAIMKAGPAPATDELVATADRLENRFFRVSLDAVGNVTSIVDKVRGGRELVDTNAETRVNQYVYHKGGGQKASVRHTIREAKLTPAAGPVMASVTAVGGCFVNEGLPRDVDRMRQTVILYRDVPRIDFVNDMVKSPSGFDIANPAQMQSAWPLERGMFEFPLNVPNFLLRHELSAGNIRPAVDRNPGEPEQWPLSIKHFNTINRWVDLSDQKDFGVTLACVDAPLMIYDMDKPNRMSSYVHNNLWYTNFQKTQPGRVIFRYSLRPHDGGDCMKGGAPRFGVEVCSPLRAGRIDKKQAGTAGFAPGSGTLLPIDQPNILLIAAKLAEANGEGVILRFNEVEGRETKVTVDLARFQPKAVVATDLVENDQTPVSLAGSKASFTVPRYGYATLRVTFGEPPAAVSNVKAVTDKDGTLVTWTAPANGAAEYELFRGTSADFVPGAGSYLATVGDCRFLDWQMTPEVKNRHFYRVRAVKPGRKGAFSPAMEPAAGTINDTTAPAKPRFTAEALRFDKVTMSWEVPADNVAIKGYKLLRDGKALADLPAVYNSWMDITTEADKQYAYTLQAYDPSGNLSEPAEAKVSTSGFEIWKSSPPKPGDNVAPLATATASSEFNGDTLRFNLIDEVNTHGLGFWMTTNADQKPWVRLEWKEPVKIARIVIHGRGYVSGTLTFSDGEPLAVKNDGNTGPSNTIVLTPRAVTWLKLDFTEVMAKQLVAIHEIEVFTEKSGAP